MDRLCFLVSVREVKMSVEKCLFPSPEEANQGKMSVGSIDINLQMDHRAVMRCN